MGARSSRFRRVRSLGRNCACGNAAWKTRSRPGQRGDEIVTVEVIVPHLQDERSREIMRELGKLNPQDPREKLFEEL